MQRMTRHFAIRFYTHWPQSQAHTGQTEDLSHNGMKFVTEHAVREGQILKIECDLYRAVAEVRRCEQRGRGFRKCWIVGAAFLTLQFERSHGTFVSTIA